MSSRRGCAPLDVKKNSANSKEADLKIRTNQLVSARKFITRNFLISMRPIHIDSGIRKALAFEKLRFCWRPGFLTSSIAASGSSEGTQKTTELTDDAQTTVETSTKFETAGEALRGIHAAIPKTVNCLKGVLSPNFYLKPYPLGAA